MKVRVLPPQRRALVDLRAFAEVPFALCVLAFFVGFTGLYMPFFYAQIFALEDHLTNDNLAFYLLAIMNSTSIFGRIVPNYIADKLGPFNVILPCSAMAAVILYCLIAAKSAAGLIVLMAFYGFFSGCYVSVPPTIIVHLSLHQRTKIGTRMGQSFAVAAVGLLIGTPIGGAILENHGFNHVWIFGGSLLAAGTAILLLSRNFHTKWKWCVKA